MTNPPPAVPSLPPWWGSLSLEEGETRTWRIGPLQLWLRRLAQEWRYAFARGDEDLAVAAAAGPCWDGELPAADGITCGRFAFRRSPAALSLLPALADRPLVARPELPLSIPPGEQVTIYVGAPLWLQLRLDEPATTLLDVPIVRPSDTWFGASTLRGELAYASRTRALLDAAALPPGAHRAIAPVMIDNRAQDLMRVERLLVPVPQLALWHAGSGLPWTSAVAFQRREGGKLGEVDVRVGAPEQLSGATLVAASRQPAEQSVVRALAAFF